MHDDKSFLPAVIDGNRLHQSLAMRRTIPRIVIDMLAPKTFGAMTSAGSMDERLYVKATMLTDE